MDQSKTPALSLVLGSRNDEYMGNSRWRLETALNYVAQNVQELDREDDVEVLVADWGSEIPLQEVLKLSPAAAKIASFLLIPPGIARELQKDSPFPEVLAVNAAARRANGQYIGRIDQDTLVGRRFLEIFFELYEGGQQLEVPLRSALLFANQRMVPYRFAVRCPSLWAVDMFISWFGRRLQIEISPWRPFYCHGVGIWLVHRNLWNECGGYDERMIYANGQEVNMIARLMKRYKMVDLGKLVDYDFYHLEHYHSLELRHSSKYLKVNPNLPFSKPDSLNPNGKDWGLIQYPLEVLPYDGKVKKAACLQALFESPRFLWVIFSAGAQIAGDNLIFWFRAAYTLWTRRAGVAWRSVCGQPLVRWPYILIRLWNERPSAQIKR